MVQSKFISFFMFLLNPWTISCWFINPKGCDPGSIRIYQWPSGFTSLHVPQFTVQIINEAWHVQAVTEVQLSCPDFASTTLINPKVFRRADPSTCLLNDGGIINPGQVITFDYSNVLPFALFVLDLKCL